MNQETIESILQYLDKVSAKLGVGVDYLWPLFVKQQYIEAYFGLALLLGFVCVCVILLIFTLKYWDPESGYSIYGSDHEVLWTFVWGISVILMFGSGIKFLMEFIDIFNPEYAAFKALLSM